MKKICLLLICSIAAIMTNAQGKDAYIKQWNTIDSLITEKGLPKSALEKVRVLYKDAKEKNNKAEIVKALVYIVELEKQLSDEQLFDAATLQKEINVATDAVQKSMLQLLLANQYADYYNQHAWQLRNRSKTAGYSKADIATWNADDFGNAITTLYEQALAPAKALQETPLSVYEPVIIKGNVRQLRPTLYDLVAHHVIDYFKNDNNYITRPAFAFEINDAAALSTADEFIAHIFSSEDSTSNILKALRLFQQLLKFHRDDKDPAAFIDVNIARITWVNDKAILENKEVLYKKALEEITAKYSHNAAAAQAWYLLARIYADNAGKFKPFGDTIHRFDYVEAKKIITARLQSDTTESEGRSNMVELLNEINSITLQSVVENINVPGQPFRMRVQYRNTDKIYIRILNAAALEHMELWNDDFWEKVVKLSFDKTYIQALPATMEDHQEHAVEVKIDALKPGSYAMLASSGSGFNDKKDKLILQRFDVSNIAYIQNGYDYFVLNRETGAPLPKAEVRLSYEVYDNKKNKYVPSASVKLSVDKNGKFTLPATENNNRGYTLYFTDGNDKLEVKANPYYRTYVNYSQDEPVNKTIYFFTDRSIYRPAQKVFFKGIAVTKDKEGTSPKLMTDGVNVTVILNDVNGKQIDSAKVQLNEYSSFSGSFVIPQNVLTGNFSISAQQFTGIANFSVEEYKRPKFYIAFDTLSSAYKLNDTITVTGYAKAYAGNTVDNAVVKFNVQRNTRFPYPWMFWRMGGERNSAQQIKNGTVKTDATGKFEISFIAAADKSVDKSTAPVFDFSVEASVIDNSGETRDGNTSIAIGYTSMQLGIDVPEKMELSNLKTIGVKATNLSGKPIAAIVNLSVAPLTAPVKVYRERLWEQPDMHIISRQEYEALFPFDLYERENDPYSWQKDAKVFESSINTGDSTVLSMQTVPFKEGWYVVEATTKDEEGNIVKDLRYVQLYNNASAALPAILPEWQATIKDIVQPGEAAELLIGSAYHDVNLLLYTSYNIHGGKDTGTYSFHSLDNKKQLFTYTAKEADRSGAGLWYAFVKHNRFYTGGTSVQVPYLHKDLQVEYTTYRNKTAPGSDETWTVTVKGDEKEKVSAELLTSMYDASLDQFKPHTWHVPDIWQNGYSYNTWQGLQSFSTVNSEENDIEELNGDFEKEYDRLLTSISQMNSAAGLEKMMVLGNNFSQRMTLPAIRIPKDANKMTIGEGDTLIEYKKDITSFLLATRENKNKSQSPPSIQPRKNFNETAFFFPQLHTDSTGNYSFSFTMPEALTEWKWLSLAHTKELAFGIQQAKVVTQKELMVQPNLPRFLRQGDKLELTAKISNLIDTALTGVASLQLFDAITDQPIDGLLQSVFPDQYFTAEAGQSTVVRFPVVIPHNYNNPLTIKIVAKAGNYADGEENTVPVLTNRMLVTETLPLYMKGEGTKEFTFDKLRSNTSPTLTSESITVEYTPQPVWYAVQALPYVMEYPYECAEQTFNRFYANALASYIIAKHPQIKEVFEKWKADTTALSSNLEKNQELKQILLAETPWVFDAQNEIQQRKNIVLLFDVASMSSNINKSLQQLQQMQMDNGAFPWFKGGYEDRYITQYILTGIGKLKKIGALKNVDAGVLSGIELRALQYADRAIQQDKKRIKKADIAKDNLGSTQIQYLYMRSFFTEDDAEAKLAAVQKYYLQQARQYWNTQSIYFKAMIAAAMVNIKEQSFAEKNIIPSILENAVTDEEKGMYWKNNKWGYYWYQSPVEQQALVIELLHEVASQKDDNKIREHINNLQTWLLLNKQTNKWQTTKATADACYALLIAGNGLSDQPLAITINIGSRTISSVEKQQQAGTGYLKERIDAKDITPSMGNISVAVSNPVGKSASYPPSWGAVYWQYFEDLDKITPAQTPLSLSKKLFIEKTSPAGKILEAVADNATLQVGDKVIIQVVLKSDRDMEYLHLKDMRASTMEPLNVLSSYKWQDGLGYYESTKDVATDFFISSLPKGTYVFEYPVYITHTGNFSAGVANIQCMYAPEFSAHSEGIRINVENKQE